MGDIISQSCFAFMDHVPCSYDGIWTLDGAVFFMLSVSLSDEAAAHRACVLFMSKPAGKRKGFLD